jgi:ribosomal protein S4E
MSTTSEHRAIRDGDRCKVVAGTHKGKSGIARDLYVSKTGHLTITIVQADGVRFKTLGKQVVALGGDA